MAVYPPSARRDAPVTKLESGDRRNSIVAAISSGEACRAIGASLRNPKVPAAGLVA
jgi:hypothetical protein